MKKTTLKDIAKQFNVSISTVSKALSDSEEISEATRKKIKEYAKKVNYRPNLNALSLKNKRTKTIGILVPDMLNYFLAQVLKGIEKTAIENAYKVVICITNDSHNKEKEIIEMLSNGSVDGFIISIGLLSSLDFGRNYFMIPLVLGIAYFLVYIYMYFNMKKLLDIKYDIKIFKIIFFSLPFFTLNFINIEITNIYENILVISIFGLYFLLNIWFQRN